MFQCRLIHVLPPFSSITPVSISFSSPARLDFGVCLVDRFLARKKVCSVGLGAISDATAGEAARLICPDFCSSSRLNQRSIFLSARIQYGHRILVPSERAAPNFPCFFGCWLCMFGYFCWRKLPRSYEASKEQGLILRVRSDCVCCSGIL